jgi:hypothetical protein
MLHILIILLVILIVVGLFLLESEIGLTGILKSIMIIAIAVVSGGAIYYCIEKINEKCPGSNYDGQPYQFIKQKWGGVGLPSTDIETSRLGTNYDIDVQAFHKGLNVYGDLKYDTSGDARLAARSQFQSQKNENAVINRSKYTTNSIKKYFEDELNASEKKNWVDNDELETYI